VSSIWTPGGEHRVPDDDPRARSAPSGAPSGAPAGAPVRAPQGEPSYLEADEGDLGAEGRAISPEELEAMRQVQAQIRATPAIDIVANHAVQLFELAAIYLGVTSPPDEQGRVPAPDLAQAGVAIDAMAAIVDGLASRLAEHEQTLRDGLGQIQMLYVQIADEQPA
jgi:hypothetical protein